MTTSHILTRPRMTRAMCMLFLFVGATLIQAAARKPAQHADPRIQPLKIVELIEPVYPLAMTVAGVTRGEVNLVFSVDAEGKLDDYLVTSYSRPEFVTEVAKVLKLWKFSPMRVDDTPIWSRARLSFNFEASGVVISRTIIDTIDMLAGDLVERARYVRVLSRQSELDGPLVVRQSVSPVYPLQLADKKIAGTVTAEFFVDEEGRVRLPVVEDGTHPWLADSAMQALLQWRFEPPVKKGRSTIVQVKQQFVFNP